MNLVFKPVTRKPNILDFLVTAQSQMSSLTLGQDLRLKGRDRQSGEQPMCRRSLVAVKPNRQVLVVSRS